MRSFRRKGRVSRRSNARRRVHRRSKRSSRRRVSRRRNQKLSSSQTGGAQEQSSPSEWDKTQLYTWLISSEMATGETKENIDNLQKVAKTVKLYNFTGLIALKLNIASWMGHDANAYNAEKIHTRLNALEEPARAKAAHALELEADRWRELLPSDWDETQLYTWLISSEMATGESQENIDNLKNVAYTVGIYNFTGTSALKLEIGKHTNSPASWMGHEANAHNAEKIHTKLRELEAAAK